METRFTDRFFAFPIKIYDGKTLRLNDGEEEDDNILPQIDGDWVIGQVRISRKDLDNILWYDGYTGELDVKDVATKGFNSTVIMTKEFGQFNCMWSKEKFEKKLNEFVEQYDLMERRNIEEGAKEYMRRATSE